MNTVRFALIGLGNIGRNLLDILVHRGAAIAATYDLHLLLVGAADSRGAALCADGLDMAALRDLKLARGSAGDLPQHGRPGLSALDMLAQADADLLVDASPTNLVDGEPGMSCVLAALERGLHLVFASKGPLVLAYEDIMAQAAALGSRVLFSGTVAGGLPTVNIGMRDLAGSGVTRVEGIFNGTTNYILTRMAQEHLSYDEAVKGAQRAGIAEADPTLDVDGWDAANKLVIIANSVLGRPTRLQDLTVKGIREITLTDLDAAAANGQAIKLLAIAEQRGADYALRVEPTWLPLSHPLARTGMWDMAVVYYTDYMGVISAIIEEEGPVPTSAAVLRDMINIYR
jgi:homoserine dehydrogenase